MFKFFKNNPISFWSVKQEQKQRMKDWINEADPFNKKLYYLLFYIKWLLIILFVYIFILCITEGVFFLQNINDPINPKAKGEFYYERNNEQIII
jgi:hypothetical protein